MSNVPPGFAHVEAYDRNPDGSVTIYCHDHNGDPLVKTLPAGSLITVIRGAR